MSLSDWQVVNIALEQIAAQTQITSLSDGSPAANAAEAVYAPTVQLLLRELDPDFSRKTAALALSGVVTPILPWSYEYVYPADCLRMRQVRPPANGYDPNDPQPVRWNVAYEAAGSSRKVVLANQVNALGVYTTSSVTEAQWDAVFTDAVARRLANPLAMALSGRPDFAREILEESARVAQTAEMVDESAVRRLG